MPVNKLTVKNYFQDNAVHAAVNHVLEGKHVKVTNQKINLLVAGKNGIITNQEIAKTPASKIQIIFRAIILFFKSFSPSFRERFRNALARVNFEMKAVRAPAQPEANKVNPLQVAKAEGKRMTIEAKTNEYVQAKKAYDILNRRAQSLDLSFSFEKRFEEIPVLEAEVLASINKIETNNKPKIVQIITKTTPKELVEQKTKIEEKLLSTLAYLNGQLAEFGLVYQQGESFLDLKNRIAIKVEAAAVHANGLKQELDLLQK